jgi:hypothetical protein
MPALGHHPPHHRLQSAAPICPSYHPNVRSFEPRSATHTEATQGNGRSSWPRPLRTGSELAAALPGCPRRDRQVLTKCSSLQQLPDTIVQLAALGNLELYGWTSLQQLPAGLDLLTGIKRLDLRGCTGLGQ